MDDLLRETQCISSIRDVLEDAASGKPFILVDGENRENEGDFIVLAEKVTPESINFMITHGSGIVCLAMDQSIADSLGLRLMDRSNVDDLYTAFATSIGARYGIGTGVSAQDRANTILAAVDNGATSSDIVTPGHVFPVIAKNGGVLERPGHTEGAVEIAKILSATPAAAICEAMNLDGTMSRLRDLIEFSQKYDIKITTMEKLIEYISQNQ